MNHEKPGFACSCGAGARSRVSGPAFTCWVPRSAWEVPQTLCLISGRAQIVDHEHTKGIEGAKHETRSQRFAPCAFREPSRFRDPKTRWLPSGTLLADAPKPRSIQARPATTAAHEAVAPVTRNLASPRSRVSGPGTQAASPPRKRGSNALALDARFRGHDRPEKPGFSKKPSFWAGHASGVAPAKAGVQRPSSGCPLSRA